VALEANRGQKPMGVEIEDWLMRLVASNGGK